MHEGSEQQLSVSMLYDDATRSPLAASAVVWSKLSGPLIVDATGRVTAEPVYQDTSGQIQAANAALSDTYDLTVTNSATDNYQEYAGDAIDDDWQIAYFGLPPNSSAAASVDFDGDGQNKRWNFSPVSTQVTPVTSFASSQPVNPARGQPRLQQGHAREKLHAPLLHRSGRFQHSGNSFTPQDEALDHPVQDTAASQTSKFYQVEITQP